MTLDIGELTEMERAARLAARRYGGDEDLVQAAWLQLLRAARTFDPACGTPFYAYCWCVAIRAVRAARLEEHAPVSGRKGHAGSVRRLVGVALERDARGGALHEEARELPEVSAAGAVPRPDDANFEADFARRVRARVAALVGQEGVPFAFAIVTKEYNAREIAAAHDLSRTRVYQLAHRVRDLLSNDAALFELWKERI